MGLTVAVDANIILPSLAGGVGAQLLFDPRYEFTTTEFTFQEVVRYLPRFAKKAGLPEPLLEQTLLLLPIKKVTPRTYRKSIKEAKRLIGRRDPKDVELLALTLTLRCPLLSHDRDFEGLPIQLVKMKDLL